MPTKLIRLTSDSGDGVFNGIFNEEILIKQDSEIALQSLSVERLSSEIILNEVSSLIEFSSIGSAAKPAVGNQTTNVDSGKYDRNNSDQLLGIIGDVMNEVCNLNSAIGQWGIQHKATINTDGNVLIGARISPFYQIQKPENCDFVVDNAPVVNDIIDAEKVNVWEEFQAGMPGMWRATDTATGGGGSEPSLKESYVYGNEPCVKSTGVFRTRFKRLNTNGAGTASFTMGLVKGADGLSKLKASSFTLADCVYAIRANGHNSPMQYLNVKGGTWIDTVSPVNHTTASWGLNLNDVMDITFLDGTVAGVISSQTAGTPTVTTLANAIDYDVGEDYYWFISLHENKDNCVLDLTGVTLDPWYGFGIDPPASIRTDNIAPGIIEQSEIDGLPLYDLNGLDDPFTPSLKLSTKLAKYLGFSSDYLPGLKVMPQVEVEYNDENDDPDGTFNQRIGYQWIATEGFDNQYDSDTYIVDTQTFTLDAYDSYGLSAVERAAGSGGSRRNIIATVPINETPIAGSGNSIIQFQPATMNYVGIKNKGDVVTRQIRCRLLTGMYRGVKTEGLASIVLLIKSPA